MVSYQMATQGARSVLQLQFIKIPTQAHQFQAEPYRCSCRVASIIERIDLGYACNLHACSHLFDSTNYRSLTAATQHMGDRRKKN